MTYKGVSVVITVVDDWQPTMQLRAKSRRHGQEIEQLWKHKNGTTEWRAIPVVDRNGNPIVEE